MVVAIRLVWVGKIKMGDKEAACKQLKWMEKQADKDNNLAEQVSHHLLNEESYADWVEKLGNSASPLLWSHAMYIILKHEIEGK